MKALIYDIEIIKAIPDRNASPAEGIQYCAGWHDHANMGISTICAYDYADGRYRVFCQDNFDQFMELCAASDLLVTFNGLSFDDKVIAATIGAMPNVRPYDLLVEVWAAHGLGPTFRYPSHAGFGLDACCEANFGTRKSGNGALAPILWQQGKIAQVIDYCINDIKLTKQLFDRVLSVGAITCPKTGKRIEMRDPYANTAFAEIA
jgi:hypothetical protein